MFVYQNHQGRVLAADAEHIFLFTLPMANPWVMQALPTAPKEALSEATVFIPRAQIKYIESKSDDAFPIVVEGPHPDVRIEFDSCNPQAQAAFMEFIALHMGFVRSENKATLMQAAPGLVWTAISTAVLTVVMFLLALGTPPEGPVTGVRRAKAQLFIALLQLLGPIGVLLIGVLVVGVSLLLAFLHYFQGFRVVRLQPPA